MNHILRLCVRSQCEVRLQLVVITFGYLLNLQNFASAAVSSTEPANFKYWGKDPRGVFNESIPVNDLPAPKFWDPQALRNAIAVEAPGQFTHLIQKLKRGEGISVLAWGSSITEGYGGCFNAGGVEYAKTRVRFLPRQYANSWCYITPHGWAGMFMQYINRTWPSQQHILVNAGISAANLAAYDNVGCHDDIMPQPIPDMIFMENVGGGNDPVAVERLVWKLTQMAHAVRRPRPAIIVLNMPHVVEDGGHRRWFECVHKKLCRANCTNDFQHELAADYGSPQESAHTVLGRYYHYSVISVRRFLMNAMADGTLKRLGWSECELLSYMNDDSVHPSPLGRQLISDLLANVIHRAEVAYENPASANTAGHDNNHNGAAGHHPGGVPARPLFQLGREVAYTRCFLYEQMEQNVQSHLNVLPETRGWVWTNYTMHGKSKKLKPGYVAMEKGAALVVKLDTVLHNTHFNTTELTLGYLTSYEHMGIARLTCVSGCECDKKGVEIDAHRKDTQHRVSVTEFVNIKVSQHPQCVVRLEVLDRTSSGEHKFKINNLLVRARSSRQRH